MAIESSGESQGTSKIKWNLKLVIIGNPARGKTSLRRTFIGKKFRVNYLPTLGADFSYISKARGINFYNITIWDLSGQPRFKNVHPQYYIGSHGAVVIYDVNDAKGDPIDTLIGWIDQYIEHSSDSSNNNPGPIMIIQNKIDLLQEDEQEKFAKKHEDTLKHLRVYYNNRLNIIGGRTSAKTGANVIECFDNYIEEIIGYQKDMNIERTISRTTPESYVLGSYLMGLDEIIGPVILARHPPADQHKYSNEEVTSLVRLSTAIDFEELSRTSYETGITMWSDPPSNLYYITFVIPNEKARGGFNLFIMGSIIRKNLKTAIADQQTMINGNLLRTMNQISEVVAGDNLRIDKPSEELLELRDNEEKNNIVIEYLEELTKNLNSVIKQHLE